MISATAATWLNYATTIVFQILFAARFGSSVEAGGFAVAFALGISVAGVFITTTTTLVMPRMVVPDGTLSRRALRTLQWAAIGIVAASALIVMTAIFARDAAADLLRLSPDLSRTVLVLTAGVVALFGLSGVIGTIALARGRRFIPAGAPAFPSTAAAIYLVLAPAPALPELFTALLVGASIQLTVIAGAAWLPRPTTSTGSDLSIGRQSVQMVAVLVAISLIPPIQRILAGSLDDAGVARFDYAARSIQAAQQLLMGGVLIALLPDWSRLVHQLPRFRATVARTVSVTAIVLAFAAAIALATAPELTALVFERGAFTSRDSQVVAEIVRLMSLGFVAEGVVLVLAQALYAGHRADLAIRIGLGRVGLQLTLSLPMGILAGAHGVAAAYTATMIVVMLVIFAASSRTIADYDATPAMRVSVGVGVIVASGIVAMMVSHVVGVWPALAVVLLVTVMSSMALRLGSAVTPGWHRPASGI